MDDNNNNITTFKKRDICITVWYNTLIEATVSRVVDT